MSPRIAVASPFRFEPDWLVEDWVEHVSWADETILIDTRGHENPWIPRADRVSWMMDAATAYGCDYLMILDIDERMSPGAEGVLRDLAVRHPYFAFKFPLFEMFTPTERRVDGIWKNKTRRRFMHIQKRRSNMEAKCLYIPNLVILHTKHLDPANDESRAQLHNTLNFWDAGYRKGTGFNYLNDRSGMLLERVPSHLLPAEPLKPWRFNMED